MAMTWTVGRTEAVIRRWYSSGVEVTSGSASYVVLRSDGAGGVLFLQADDTWGASSATRSMSYVAGVGWFAELDVVSAMRGYNVHVVATHSTTAPPLAESAWVRESTQKDISLTP